MVLMLENLSNTCINLHYLKVVIQEKIEGGDSQFYNQMIFT